MNCQNINTFIIPRKDKIDEKKLARQSNLLQMFNKHFRFKKRKKKYIE